MAALRNPETGCPWDIVQTFETIKPYTIEEAYEVSDAIERNDMDDLCDELGDLLLQVVFHARMAEEAGEFAFGDVVEAITRKMIRRHPHVFAVLRRRYARRGQGSNGTRSSRQKSASAPSAAHGAASPRISKAGFLGSVQRSFPALDRGAETAGTRRQGRLRLVGAGTDPRQDRGGDRRIARGACERRQAKVSDELGDLIFAVVNIGRHVKADPEQALRGTNTKFRRRFNHIETDARSRRGNAWKAQRWSGWKRSGRQPRRSSGSLAEPSG